MSNVKENKEAHGAPTGTAQRVLYVLELLADAEGPVSVRHAAGQLGLAPSTTHRMLNLLVEGGFAKYDPRSTTYSVGSHLYRVASRVMATVNPVTIASDAISGIAERYDETILFGLYLPKDRALSFSARADGQNRLLYRIDMNVPLSLVWGASGKAALAYLPEDEILAILAEEAASPASGAAPPTPETLLAELARVRDNGYCVSLGEKLPEALGVAAPVFGPQGLLGSLCLTMPRSRAPQTDTATLGAEIARAAEELSHRLGGAPTP